jgi:hypothetical protein
MLVLAMGETICNNKTMCEYNRPYLAPFGQHPDDIYGGHQPEIIVRSPEVWAEREAALPRGEAAVIEQAIQEAAVIAADVHLYRKVGSPILGLALVPGKGPTVKIWEH